MEMINKKKKQCLDYALQTICWCQCRMAAFGVVCKWFVDLEQNRTLKEPK